MEEQVQSFLDGFSYTPEVVGGDRIPKDIPIVVCGMGGSRLGAAVLATDSSCPSLFFHSDYGLPRLPTVLSATALVVGISYSGDTEEVLDAVKASYERGLPVAVVTSGGALYTFAKEHGLPHVLLPTLPVEPRMTIGYQMRALALLTKNEELYANVMAAGGVDEEEARHEGEALADALRDLTPVFYGSNHYAGALAYAKAVINETGKTAAFANVVPELCHNELSGYETGSHTLLPVLCMDQGDRPEIRNTMGILHDLLSEKGVRAHTLRLSGATLLQKAAHLCLVSTFTGIALAKHVGVDDTATPLITEFKKRLRA